MSRRDGADGPQNHSAVVGGDRNRFEGDQILGMAKTERPNDYSSFRELGYFAENGNAEGITSFFKVTLGIIKGFARKLEPASRGR